MPVGGGEKLRALLAARDLTRRGPHPGPDRSPGPEPEPDPDPDPELTLSLGLTLSLTRLAALLEERGFVHGEWFADYALAVLSP